MTIAYMVLLSVGSPPSKVAMVPRAYLETVLLMPPQRPLSVDTGTTRLCSTSTAAEQN